MTSFVTPVATFHDKSGRYGTFSLPLVPIVPSCLRVRVNRILFDGGVYDEVRSRAGKK